MSRAAKLLAADPLRFAMPLPPNLANGRMHWAAKDKKRSAFFDRCDLLALATYCPRPASPLSGVELSAHLYVAQRMDDDNALARIKWASDWLVRRKYLVDDKRPHCCFTIPLQTIDRKNPRLEITLSLLARPRAEIVIGPL